MPAGQAAHAGGYTIHGGLVYSGCGLAAEKGGMPEPALIDPRLPVDTRNPDYAGTKMGYWPSYASIPPDCRAAYLHWLLDGRRAPGAYIGYVFLYFYGLERRLLVDSQQSPAARAEHPVLVREVERLLRIYGSNGSFSGYASSLLRFLSLDGGHRRYLSAPPQQQEGWELPFELRLGLGQLAADGRPVPAGWALAWIRQHPAAWLRTPAARCPDEFDELFTRRYRERFGDGMMLERGGPLLPAEYRPASPGITSRDRPAGLRVPDAGNAEAPLGELREVASAVCTELDAYSRYLGRHPDAAGTAGALALLPAGLERPASAASQALAAWARSRLDHEDQATVPAADLLAHWSAASAGGGSPKAEAELLARALERSGVGMEPDVRFGGQAPAAGTRVVLFRRAAEITAVPGAGYAAAATLIELSAAVALADGRLADAERTVIAQRVMSRPGLGEDERRRLHAHFTRVIVDPPAPAALRKHVTLLPADLRQEAGDLLLAVALADGSIDRAEVTRVNRYFDALGLDRPGLASGPQAAGNGGLTPVRTAGAPSPGYAIPRPPQQDKPVSAGVALDPEVIKAKLAETEQAASILAGIFTGEDTSSFTALPATAAPGSPSPQAGGLLPPALDAAHRSFLARLAERPSWRRSEVASIAAGLGLMPDGALEVVNEAAFELAGDPATEGSDPIEVNTDVAKEILR
ncbi:TerB N-terminal domain-containing protein [Trebonia kvetii]|nr:TerB N-terminal domain-containing protein [Trebonia kvetii]